jgi:hypothetical protein
MSKVKLDKFGQLLMTKVRDEAISDWDRIVDGRMKSQRASELHQAVATFSEEQQKVFLSLVPEVVDTVLHHLLWMFDQRNDVMLGVRSDDKKIENLKEISDGLPGELYSDEGWIARFSKARKTI